MVPPGQELSSISQPGSSRGIRCLLDAALLESFLDDAPEWHDALLHQAFHLSGGQIEWLMRRMYREMAAPDFATVPVLEALTKQLAAEIVRKFRLRSINDFRAGGLAPWRMQRIRERLYADDALPDLTELARLCDMTVRHLSRAFRTETGQTLGKYMEQVMVERATRMLGSGMTIGDVGMALGFSGAGGFRSAFRRSTGLLPGEIKASGRGRRLAGD
jgi:AraC family transcriptional regulator